MKTLPRCIQKVFWQDIRNDVHQVNPTIAEIIDELSPGQDYPLYLTTLPYGVEMVKDGVLHLPDDNNVLHSIHDLPAEIQEHLSYNGGSNPAGVNLGKPLELFLDLETMPVPYAVIPKGAVFGFWKQMDQGISHCPETFIWGMTSGVRSLFMLPSISNEKAHTRLKSLYAFQLEKPKQIRAHWDVFRHIAWGTTDETWRTQTLFFSKAWIDKIHDPAWKALKFHLLDKLWDGSSYWRNQYMWDIIFKLIEQKFNYRHSYYSDIVKQILTISTGALPGYSICVNEEAAPIKAIQHAYLDVYQLRALRE